MSVRQICHANEACDIDLAKEEMCKWCQGWMDAADHYDCGGDACFPNVCEMCKTYQEGLKNATERIYDLLWEKGKVTGCVKERGVFVEAVIRGSW
ncbi:hypothetical protein AB0L75_34685 [Streptomyces sp. NPDC052101]|uniref:hypothetical protein n=1 Tax=Streptomyces sp. NPDC052101 TaxID=3155763 RepID=UPI0034204C5D